MGGKSCVDNIFIIHQIKKKIAAKRQELHLIFIDLENVYDSVPISKL